MHSRVHDSRPYLEAWADSKGIGTAPLRRVYEAFEVSTQEDREHEHEFQEPGFYMPGLAASPWWESERFPWIADMEQAFPMIRGEFEDVGGLRSPESVKHPSNLDDDGRWAAYYFFYVGRRYADHAKACPVTTQALAAVPGSAECGMAYYSIMDPHTHVAAHSGFTNTHLRCHLGLRIPADCRMRVGSETRGWAEDRVNVFDDSFNHEVWNDDDQGRAVLLFDTWHPDLTRIETEALAQLVRVWRRFIYMDAVAGIGAGASPAGVS